MGWCPYYPFFNASHILKYANNLQVSSVVWINIFGHICYVVTASILMCFCKDFHATHTECLTLQSKIGQFFILPLKKVLYQISYGQFQ